MGRMTGYDADRGLIVREEERILHANGIITKDEMYKIMRHLAEKLSEYEDLEEQGKLLRPPCVVGNKAYRISRDARNTIIETMITEIRYKMLRSNIVIVKLIVSDDIAVETNGCSVYYAEEIGKKIFLTQEEAEAALKELGGKDE